MNKKEILAFHEHNLEEVLERLGLLEEFKNKKLRCSICNRIITKENLGGIYPENGKIKVCCSDLKCLNKIKI
jgi:uncharacterized protein with PIN domain